MSDNEHVQAIREAADDIQRWVPLRSLPHHEDVFAAAAAARHHADAMEQQLAEAEARCQRKDAYIARITARLDAVRRALEDAPGEANTDPMATTVTPLQREAVVRELIRAARSGAQGRNADLLVGWLWSRIPDGDGDPT